MHYKRKLSYILFIFIAFVFSCSKDPDVCECLQLSIDANKALENSLENYSDKLRINNQNEENLSDCIDYINGLSAAEKERMEEEAQKCTNFESYIKLFDK